MRLARLFSQLLITLQVLIAIKFLAMHLMLVYIRQQISALAASNSPESIELLSNLNKLDSVVIGLSSLDILSFLVMSFILYKLRYKKLVDRYGYCPS